MEPLDFEDFILQHQSLGDETGNISTLSEFPDDDVEVTNIPRKFRTLPPHVPELPQYVVL